jgi:DNA repair protein RadA/Sms
VIFGEIGLSGEIRRVSQPDLRLKEAVKLGFTQAIMPQQAEKTRKPPADSLRRAEIRLLKDLLPLFQPENEIRRAS